MTVITFAYFDYKINKNIVNAKSFTAFYNKINNNFVTLQSQNKI